MSATVKITFVNAPHNSSTRVTQYQDPKTGQQVTVTNWSTPAR